MFDFIKGDKEDDRKVKKVSKIKEKNGEKKEKVEDNINLKSVVNQMNIKNIEYKDKIRKEKIYIKEKIKKLKEENTKVNYDEFIRILRGELPPNRKEYDNVSSLTFVIEDIDGKKNIRKLLEFQI